MTCFIPSILQKNFYILQNRIYRPYLKNIHTHIQYIVSKIVDKLFIQWYNKPAQKKIIHININHRQPKILAAVKSYRRNGYVSGSKKRRKNFGF